MAKTNGYLGINLENWKVFTGKRYKDLEIDADVPLNSLAKYRGSVKIGKFNLRKLTKSLNIHPPERLVEEPIDWATHEKGNFEAVSPTLEAEETVPFYNIRVSAGYINEWVGNSGEERIRAARFLKEVDFALQVEGDSMTNPEEAYEIPHGAILGCKPLSSFDTPAKGKIYVISQRDKQPLVKKFCGVNEFGEIQIASLNPNYAANTISTDDAPQFYKIVEVLRNDVWEE